MEKMIGLEAKAEKNKRMIGELEAGIKNIREGATAENVRRDGLRLLELETQLNLTEQSLFNVQKEIEDLREYEGSKEYKEMVKKQEAILQEIKEKTKEFLSRYKALQGEASTILKQAKELDHLNRKTGFPFNNCNCSRTQPFMWLSLVEKTMIQRLKDSEFIKDRF